ncbi:MAG: hypothetical protein IBX55_23685 [Methyloprofundus sp.]|nr:hypothetical protein [Methyloprofundus sp.]
MVELIGLSAYSLLVGQKLVVQQVHLLYPIYALVVYTVFSMLWHPDLFVWARYHFYLACGLIALFAVYQYVIDFKSLNKVFAVLVGFLLLNFFIGVLESLELLRLPTSRYSPYLHHFGYSGSDLAVLSDSALSVVLANKPTGFNFNPNNFGFVLMLIAPFVFFHKSFLVKAIGLFVIVWLFFSIGSRTHFVAFLLMLAALPFFMRLSYGKAILIMLFPFLLAFIMFLPEVIDLSSRDANRMYSAFDSIISGLQLMASGDIQPGDSTSTRAYIYLFGITQLFNSYGVGLGFGGIESLLIQYDFKIQAFHFFFLQLLVDLGVFVFMFFMVFYLRLILVLRRISNKASNKAIAYFAKSSSLALLIAIPASVAPSGVHYILTFYLLIGFALAIIKVYNLEKFNENSITRCR